MAVPTCIHFEGGVLRRWSPSHALALSEAIDSSRAHLGAWMPWANEPSDDVLAQAEWIRRTHEDWATGRAYSFGAFSGDDVVGACSLHSIRDGTARLGYWIRATHIRRGIGTEMVSALVTVGFEIGLRRLEIRTDRANIASRRIAARLGFTFVGPEPHSIDAPAQTGVSFVHRLDADPPPNS